MNVTTTKKRHVFRYDSVSKMGLNMVGASVIVPDSSDGTDPENPYADGKSSLIALIMRNSLTFNLIAHRYVF